MKVYVNGQVRSLISGLTVASLLDDLQYGTERIAVEVNEDIVPRSQYDAHRLQDGDRVEIVRAIGGGSALNAQ